MVYEPCVFFLILHSSYISKIDKIVISLHIYIYIYILNFIGIYVKHLDMLCGLLKTCVIVNFQYAEQLKEAFLACKDIVLHSTKNFNYS